MGIVGRLALRNPDILAYDYASQDLMATFLKPGTEGHPLGTDQLGRDMLSRLIVGIGISLSVGFGVTAISMAIGLVAGSIAGYRSGWPDTIISGIIEITWGFPLILIAVIIAGAIGPGLISIVLAIALINWAGFARLIRGEVMVLRNQEFVQAARATSRRRLANTLSPYPAAHDRAGPGHGLVLRGGGNHCRGGVLVHRIRRAASNAESWVR
ncbi:MAG: ABC transporter permease [Thermomicrobiales bacterium]